MRKLKNTKAKRKEHNFKNCQLFPAITKMNTHKNTKKQARSSYSIPFSSFSFCLFAELIKNDEIDCFSSLSASFFLSLSSVFGRTLPLFSVDEIRRRLQLWCLFPFVRYRPIPSPSVSFRDPSLLQCFETTSERLL